MTTLHGLHSSCGVMFADADNFIHMLKVYPMVRPMKCSSCWWFLSKGALGLKVKNQRAYSMIMICYELQISYWNWHAQSNTIQKEDSLKLRLYLPPQKHLRNHINSHLMLYFDVSTYRSFIHTLFSLISSVVTLSHGHNLKIGDDYW